MGPQPQTFSRSRGREDGPRHRLEREALHPAFHRVRESGSLFRITTKGARYAARLRPRLRCACMHVRMLSALLVCFGVFSNPHATLRMGRVFDTMTAYVLSSCD